MLIETDYRALHSAGQDGLPLVVADCVVVIGNFDGVHRGHQALLAAGRELARENAAALVVLTFAPHPRSYFKPDQPPFLLTDAVQKHELLFAAGADAIVELKFDALLSALTPEEFAGFVLADGLRARHVVVGENFIFGRQRKGDLAALKTYGKQRGFGVTGLKMLADFGDKRIASENIRTNLRQGHTASAEEGLGRPWQLRGEVVRGQQKGRTIGYPTANLSLGDYLQPKFGIYSARVRLEGEGETHKAAVSIGIRPTVGGIMPNLEAYLLDFSGDLYGRVLRVDIGDFLRGEQKFTDLEALKAQIDKDVARVREILV